MKKKPKRDDQAELDEMQGIPEHMLFEIFDEPIIAQRWAVRATGSMTAAVMISHALSITQSSGDANDGWFRKTIAEWEEEVGLSRAEQETARFRLIELGLMQERRIGMPARLEYRVDLEQVFETISIQSERFVQVKRHEKHHADEAPLSNPPIKAAPPLSVFPPGQRAL